MTPALSPEQLRRNCTTTKFPFETTEELESAIRIIGQPRGVKAIDFGIKINSPGYNIFVMGQAGTGRTTAIERFVEMQALDAPVPPDWVYVHNFAEPHKPRAIPLPPGMGAKFREIVNHAIERLQEDIPRTFDSQTYRDAVLEIQHKLAQKRESLFKALQTRALKQGAALLSTPQGFQLVPAKDGEPIPPDVFQKQPPEDIAAWRKVANDLERELNETIHQARQLENHAYKSVQDLDRGVAGSVVDLTLEEVEKEFADHEEILTYVAQVQKDIVENVQLFRLSEDDERKGAPPPTIRFRRYRVNVIVGQTLGKGAPVVVEYNPSIPRLLGRVEHEVRYGGEIITDFTILRGGALHTANGGYLVLRARDLFAEPGAWDALKRALVGGCIQPDDPAIRSGATTRSLEPEEIPLDVKVLLIGPPQLYYTLHAMDEDFRTTFKVMADFARDMERSKENEMEYAVFIGTLCRDEGLCHFDRNAVGGVIEFSSRLAGTQNKLSTRFGQIADLVREASYWAQNNGYEIVRQEDVWRAIEEQIFLRNRVETRLREGLHDGKKIIASSGSVVGQINGLSVSQIGEHAFGQPSRVTARTYVGKKGVVQIDREVALAGPIHNKGVLTLTGYLGGRYAGAHPLSLSAQITFEQNYGGVEGDSASSTELYALLSSLSGFPIKQALAVTGSVNQRAEIQALGGATEKVEGWFKVCEERGLTGEQGALIPASNAPDLMLRNSVVEAVAAGKFHIWAVSTVDEGIELLTGRSAAEVHDAVKARLQELAEIGKEFD